VAKRKAATAVSLRRPKSNVFASETELCVEFAEYAKTLGWRVYPETSGFDLLLVAAPEVKTVGARPGEQIGVQAKLTVNMHLFAQAIPNARANAGPNFFAVLVPSADTDCFAVARRLGVVVFTAAMYRKWSDPPWQKKLGGLEHLIARHHVFDAPAWTPEVEIWTPPGVKSPSIITPWKIDAVKLCLLGEKKGFLTTVDFIEHGISTTLWVARKWIVDTGDKIGKRKKYRLGEVTPHLLWPEITEALRRRADKPSEEA